MSKWRFQPGFSLVEILVSISIVAILIAITLPALSGARFQGKVVKTLSVQHQLLLSISMYASDYGGYYPYLATPGQPEEPLVIWGNVIKTSYFYGQRVFWPSVLVPEYYAVSSNVSLAASLNRPPSRTYPDGVVSSRYWLTSSVVAAPAYWRDPSPNANPDVSLLRGTRHASVLFPAQKGLLLDIGLGVVNPQNNAGENDQNAYAGLADGSARVFNFFTDIDPEAGLLRPWGGNPFAFMTTPHGIAGIDFK